MRSTLPPVDFVAAHALIGAHLRRYAIDQDLMTAEYADGKLSELPDIGTALLAREVMWDRLELDGEQGLAAGFFAEGFMLALRLAEVASAAPLSPDIQAIEDALDVVQQEMQMGIDGFRGDEALVRSRS